VEVVVHQDERVQGDAVLAEGPAKQVPEMVAIVRIEEDRALVDASLGEVQRDARQFEARQSWHGGRPWVPPATVR